MKQTITHLPSRSEILQLKLQRAVCHVLNAALYALSAFWMRVLMNYRIKNIREVRKRYKDLVIQSPRATLVCPNHLTLIDSLIILWAFAPWWRYMLSFAHFSWNIPEKRNYFGSTFKRLFCYVGKCIPVVRRAPKEETQKTLNKLLYLLSKGDNLTIFPEGTRSRSGILDTENFTYGPGTILQNIPDLNVLCVYVRGEHQNAASNYPKKGDHIYIDLDLIKPHSELKGMRGARDLSTQIIQHLSTMEHEYFEKHATHRQ